MDWNAAVPVQIVEPIDRWWPLVICWDWLLWRVTSFPWSPPGRMVGRHCPTGNAWAVTRAASQRARPVYRTDFSSNSFHSYPIWTCPDFLSRRIPSVGSFYDFFPDSNILRYSKGFFDGIIGFHCCILFRIFYFNLKCKGPVC